MLWCGAGSAADPYSERAIAANQQAERQLEVDFLQVVAARAAHRDAVLARAAPMRRHVDLQRPAEIAPGQRARVRDHFLGPALRDDMATGLAGAGTHVEHVV